MVICQNAIDCGVLVSTVGAVRVLLLNVEALTLRMYLPEPSERDSGDYPFISAGIASIITRLGMGNLSRLKTIDFERQYIAFYSPDR